MVPKALEDLQDRIIQKDSEFEANCYRCGLPVHLPKRLPPGYIPQIADIVCRQCVEEEQEARHAKTLSFFSDSLQGIVPPSFLQTEASKLPKPEMLEKALQWRFGPIGLLLYGPTRSGKSRIAWEVAKREIRNRRKIRAVDSFDLMRYPALFMENGGAATRFAEELESADITLLDDVFKAKTTERVEELLFAIIDRRSCWQRPCIITLNDTGESLGQRFSQDRGPALIHRLREFCQPVGFQ